MNTCMSFFNNVWREWESISNSVEKNLKGLIYCYIAAIPFFKNTLFSTIIFSYGAFLTNYFVNKKLTWLVILNRLG